MSNEGDELGIGQIQWQDLTVTNAIEIRDFYRKIIDWDCVPEEMGGYEDYHMILPSTGNSVVGICHAKGGNADMPPVWLIYITVEDVDKSAKMCQELGGEELGGEVVVGPGQMGGGRFCVIRDPAGAMCGLYRPPEKS